MTVPPVLWRPDAARIERATITSYTRWLEETRGLELPDYASLWEWSTRDIEGFWASIWERFDVISSTPYERVLGSRAMPGAEWFPGARLNYAEHALRAAQPGRRRDQARVGAATARDDDARRAPRTRSRRSPGASAHSASAREIGSPRTCRTSPRP